MEIRKPVVRVQNIIAKILEQSAVKAVRPGAGHDGNLTARCTPELRGKRRRLHTKLLHGIHGHEAVRAA